MSKGLLGKKIGMTSIFDEQSGGQYPCTVIEVVPNVVTQLRTEEKDGYTAVQLGIGERKEKRTSKAMRGHFEAAGTTPKRHLREFNFDGVELSAGDLVRIEDVFEEGDVINVAGTSKGKGFQGVVKRHGFRGVGDATHGQHNRQRAPGAIGAGSDPSRVFKGMRMAGRTGNDRVTMKNLQILRIMPDQNAVLVTGAVPGPKNGLVELRKK
ncbi:MAG: 50S ribosomal protein L3 [Bacteroidetes Order II. Incertae sedis bacterium]|jgi:large subunit ribosomal protein L3|nr:50S ribosomal protein L3 [Bacteroidetes Order II. bacterium]MDG1755343.1 50S ribosomal protein L3 [Rhodothermales bacterium]MBT5249327.1 50S ribosomal protein L3 [Bacteroidetes Order II. bacterium]MBT6200810.1 50S ribosomal protein L3 [Bacteroidetes Order II. bacterium]MBT6423750.1 50S ribosomal protein L3 [Bacteroidetes Order II. bacterium]